jgi:hypothetical protein
VVVIHGTKKLRDRLKASPVVAGDESTTLLGPWFATILFWKPQVALLVNKATLLPLLMPFAPSATLLDRFAPAAADVLEAHDVPARFVEHEVAEMSEHRLATTNDRSVVGIMNEFTFLAEVYRESDPDGDLTAIALWLAGTPCGPLYARHGSPDRELAAFVAAAQI